MSLFSPLLIVCIDRDTADNLPELAGSLGYADAHIVQGGFAEAVAAMNSRTTSPDYIIIDIGNRGSGILPELDDFSQYCEASVRVVVIGTINDIVFYRELKSRGILEYFTHPAPAADIRGILMQGPTHFQGGAVSATQGSVISFMSAASGDGGSTLAINFAYSLAEQMGQPTVLVDMDYQFGLISKCLDLSTPFGIRELFDHPDRGLDEMLISKMLVKYTDNLSIIAAPSDLRLLPHVRPELIREMIGILRSQFAFVVIDVPHIWTDWSAAVITYSNHVFLVAQLWLRSLTHTSRLLASWHSIGVERNDISVVINRSGAKFKEGITAEDFERICHHKIAAHVNNDVKAITIAENHAKTLFEAQQGEKLQQQITQIAENVAMRYQGYKGGMAPPPRGGKKGIRGLLEKKKLMFGKKTPTSNLPVPVARQSGQDIASSVNKSIETIKLNERKLFAQISSSFNEISESHKHAEARFTDAALETSEYMQAKKILTENMLEKLDFAGLDKLDDEVKKSRIRDAAAQIIADINIPLTAAQVALLKDQAIDDLLGFGPIEVLMADPDIADIMINGHEKVFIEKQGKIQLTDVTFGSEKHLLNVIQKIVSIVGRRIDESSPMVDARMPDGSRFNAIIPPLALDGCLVSIRKFKKNKMPLKRYVELGSMSEQMYKFLDIAGNIRLNMIISGGTGSGKTTLLNAISGSIDPRERVITIEDAAELLLQQPHVLRMETRPPNMEGIGEISQRALVRNALRMRPDRIIIGEIRGDEVIDVLSAMNTGHDGSMATIHANTPADALSRIENLVGMSAVKLSMASLRHQIASAIHVVVQVARQRDGQRRIVQIDEISGLQGENISTQTLFAFRPEGMDANGTLKGYYHCTGARPRFLPQAAYFGREKELLECLTPTEQG